MQERLGGSGRVVEDGCSPPLNYQLRPWFTASDMGVGFAPLSISTHLEILTKLLSEPTPCNVTEVLLRSGKKHDAVSYPPRVGDEIFVRIHDFKLEHAHSLFCQGVMMHTRHGVASTSGRPKGQPGGGVLECYEAGTRYTHPFSV